MRIYTLKTLGLAIAVWLSLFSQAGTVFGAAPAQDVEGVLRSMEHYRGVSHLSPNHPIIAALKEAGVNNASDFIPFLGRDEELRSKALLVMASLGNFDSETLQAIEGIARNPTATESRFLAVGIIMSNKPREQAVEFGLSMVSTTDPRTLSRIVGWLVSQDERWVNDDARAQALFRACCQHMKSLFQGENDLRTWGGDLLFKANRYPGSREDKLDCLVEASLLALSNLARLDDVSIGFAFSILKEHAESVPEIVEKGLVKIVSETTPDVTKIVLWQVYLSKLAESTVGMRVIEAALRKWPELSEYTGRLDRTSFTSGHWGDDPQVGREVQRTLYKLWGWQSNR